ncbi:Uncharacterised protein [Mycobacteroides abscessus subsp. massiliense]|nr:Uncharacterised protein [Mycobacteroides abscessus subsp. massiliense]
MQAAGLEVVERSGFFGAADHLDADEVVLAGGPVVLHQMPVLHELDRVLA